MEVLTQHKLPQEVQIDSPNHQGELVVPSPRKHIATFKLILGLQWGVDPHLSEPTLLSGSEVSIASVFCHMEET